MLLHPRSPAVIVVVAVVFLSACEVVTPTNPFDSATPPELQATGALRGAIVLRDATVDGAFVGERAALSRITVGLRDADGRPLERDGTAVAHALTDVDPAFAADAGRGAFAFDDLTPGTYTLVVAGVPAAYGVAGAVVAAIGPGQDADVGDIAFTYTVDRDDGFVIDGETGTAGPAAGPQTVSLFQVDDAGVVSFVKSTASVGAFRFAGLLPGTYGLLVEGQGQMPAYRLDVPVDSAQAQRTFSGADAITLHPVTAVLLPITSGDGAVVNVEGDNYVREAPVPLAVLGFATDAAAEVGVTRMRLSTSDTFVDDAGNEVPFGDYAASTTFALPARDGRHTIHAQFQAQSDKGFTFTSPTFSIDVVRDTVAPAIPAATLPGLPTDGEVALSSSRTVPLRALVRDATSAVAAFGVGIDAAPAALDVVVAAAGDVQIERTITFATDGTHTLQLVARDRARNDTAAAPTLVQVHVDTVAPDVAFSIDNASGGVLPDAYAQLRVASNVAGDDDLLVGFGFEGQLITPDTPLVDDGDGPVATAIVRLPADAQPGGTFTFEAVVVDRVGNETRVTQTVALPPAPSAPQLVIDGGAAFTNDRAVRLRLAAQDFTRVCVVNLEAQACFDAADVQGEVPFSLATTSGKAVVVATFVDGAGHAVSASDSIVVDVDGPTLASAVDLNGGAAFSTSVSANVTVEAVGADEMAIVVADGDALTSLDSASLTFQPYARQSVVLLPSGDGEKTVCVVLRDAAGNVLVPADDPRACATTTLDTTAPASPVVISDDGQVLRTPSDHLFRVFIAPLDVDVDHVRITVEGPFGSQPAPAPGIFPVLPVGTAHPPHVGAECAAPPSDGGPSAPCFLDVTVLGDVSDGDDTPHLLRLTAVDHAGNVSAQATFTVTYDNKAPGVPTIADVDVHADGVVFPRQLQSARGQNGVASKPTCTDDTTCGDLVCNAAVVCEPDPGCVGGQSCPDGCWGFCVPKRAPTVNSDSFAVRIVTPPRRIDRNFDHYEVARTVGKRVVGGALVVRTPRDGLLANGAIDPASALRPDATDLPFTASAGADSLIVPLVQGAPLNGSGNDGVMCTPRACLNHIFLRAVDAAGNVGPELRIDIVEDSGPPTRPTLSPRGGAMVGSEAAIRLQADSVDDSDFCDDVSDCDPGLTCEKNLCIAASVGGGVPVRAYELKQGTDGSFGGVPPGQPVGGPWRMRLVPGETSTLCARGVDDAGNVGIEDCVDVDEQSTAPRVALAAAREREPHIAGDYIVYRVDDRLFVNDLAGPAPAAVGDDLLLDGMLAPRSSGNAGGTGVDVNADVDNGVDLLAIAAQGNVQGTDVVQVRFGHPHPRVDELPGNAITARAAQRTFRGAVPTLLGHKVIFACTSNGTTRLMRADLDRLFAAGVPPAGVVSGDPSVVLVTQYASCPTVDVTGTFATLATLDAGKRLCTNTSPVATNTALAWCETSSSGATETGTIVALLAGAPATVPLGAAATSRHGDLIDGGVGTPIRPVASTGRLAWVDAVTGTIHDLVAVPGAQPRDTGVTAGDLYDIDADELVYADVRADGLTDDLYAVDLRPATPAAQRLTDDLPPNSDGAVAQGRVAVTSFSSRGEDVDLLRTGQDAWLASSDTFRFLPATSATRAAWVELRDDGLAVLSVDVNSGEQATVVDGTALFDRLTFIGGSFLGNAPVDVGGDTVALAHEDTGGASWTASFFAARGQGAAVLSSVSGIAAALPGTRDGSLAWDVDADGDAVGYVDVATGNLVVQRIPPSPAPLVSVPSLRGVVDTNLVPYVSVDDVGSLSVAVWQLGNIGNIGDVRRDRQGTLMYAERRGSTTTTAKLRAAGGGDVVGRAPSVAIVDGRVFLAWQTATLVNNPGGGFVMHRTRVCEVVVTGSVPACTNERALDDAQNPSGDSGAPVVSRRGFVAWPNGVGRTLSQVDVYDLFRNARVSLTAGLDDGLARDSVVVGGDLVVWLDSRLGTSDVWYATAP